MHGDQNKSGSAIRWSIAVFAAYALIGGGATLVGWSARLPRLTDWTGSGIAMFPNTAFSAVCAGTALILAMRNRPWCGRISAILGTVVAIVGGATLFQHFFGVNLGIDTILVKPEWGEKAAAAPGRMGPPASASFMLLGVALILIAVGRERLRRIIPALGIVVCVIAALALMGYLAGANPLFAVARFTGIAMQTASILLALGLGVIAAVPECEPLRTLRSDGAAGLLARRSLPFIIGLPVVLGWLRIRGQQAGLFDTVMGTALLIMALVVVFCGLLWWWTGAVAKHESQVRQLNAALKHKLDEMTTLQNLLPVGVWIGNRDCSEIRGNPAAYRIFGFQENINASITADRPELPHGLRIRVNGIEVPPDEAPMQKVARTGQPWNNFEHDITFPDGTTKVVYGSVAPLFDEIGQVRQVIGAYTDFTERKRTEVALRAAHAQLADRALQLEALVQERTAKLQEMVAELQHISYAMVHDMRAPLRAMNAFIELIGEAQTTPEQRQDYGQRLRASANRLDHLVQYALHYTKIAHQEATLHPVNLSNLIGGLMGTYPNLQADKADICVEGELPVVLGNEALLTQCFSHLLGNAVKFVAAGVRPQVHVQTERKNGSVRIWIKDNGIGIPEHAHRRLFMMFQRLHEDYEGTGIGLAIVRKVVERMNGKVGLESDAGRGSNFWVELPLVEPNN